MATAARRQKAPLTAELHVESLAHDGRGVARLDGKTVFVHGALPGERVLFRRTRRRRRYDEGVTTEVLAPAPERVEPRCTFYDVCGGCSLQHLDTARQIEVKQEHLLDNLADLGGVRPGQIYPPVRGPQWGYRRKARLGVKNVPGKGRVLVGFRERGSPFIADMTRCEVLHPQVGDRIEALSALVGSLELRSRLPQIEVAVGEDAAALVFRILDEPCGADRERLGRFGEEHGFRIYLQTGGPGTVAPLDGAAAPLRYTLPDQNIEMRFEPTDFTQINFEINRRMVTRALELLDPGPGDRVLDLFCGLGNLTLPAARFAAEAVGVEGDGALVGRARDNAAHNGLDNAAFHAADLQDPAMLDCAPWLRAGFDHVLLDPPRSGAREVLRAVAASGARRVVYVSCHPATLARDAAVLTAELGFTLRGAGVLDMFPQTAHVESIACFERS